MKTDTPYRALVLGAGGHAAIAWETGTIVGMADAGIDVRDADAFIGTSAGSIVSAQITSGIGLDELFDRLVAPQQPPGESAPAVDMLRWRADLFRVKEEAGSAVEFLQRIGSLAAAVPETTDRRSVIASRLPVHSWPDQKLQIVAVDAASGQRRAFDRVSQAPLIDAVAASAAVPGIWPLVTIDGRPYMDGGMYSIDNADLALGAERVLILTLPSRVPSLCVQSLDEAVQMLRHSGARVEVVHPDEATLAAFASVGGNLLDPAVRESAARAGRAQGRSEATRRIAEFWKS